MNSSIVSEQAHSLPVKMPRKFEYGLQFLDLPIEIQRLIFAKCFEEPWVVKGMGYIALHVIRYSSNVPTISLLYVNKHFHRETLYAISSSRSGRFEGFNPATSYADSWSRPPMIFDSAITVVELPMRQLENLSSLRQRYPNIERVELNGDETRHFHETMGILTMKPMLHILQGKYDAELARSAEFDFHVAIAPMLVDHPAKSYASSRPVLRRLGITLSAQIRYYGVLQKWYTLGQTLLIKFESGGQGCRLVEKRFVVPTHKYFELSLEDAIALLKEEDGTT